MIQHHEPLACYETQRSSANPMQTRRANTRKTRPNQDSTMPQLIADNMRFSQCLSPYLAAKRHALPSHSTCSAPLKGGNPQTAGRRKPPTQLAPPTETNKGRASTAKVTTPGHPKQPSNHSIRQPLACSLAATRIFHDSALGLSTYHEALLVLFPTIISDPG